jgi:VanZ family protein
VLSLLPDTEIISSRTAVEFDHLIAYSVLTICWLVTCRDPSAYVPLGVFAYGLVLELLQISVPGRTFEWLDVAANAIGVLAGWTALLIGRTLVGQGQK